MADSSLLSVSALLGFLLTLARVAGTFVFVPMPGLKSGFELPRVVLAASISVALYPQWPRVAADASAGLFALWMISEAALGIGIGLGVGFVTEAFGVAAQVLGLQAGYAYASTVDPTTQADSSVLVILSQLASGLLFFAMGIDREVIRIFARSLDLCPPGSFVLQRNAAEHLLSSGSMMLSTGLRLALPVIAVLAMVDISLALLGRVNAQLQLLSIAFPVKMLVALALLGWIMLLMPSLFRTASSISLSAVQALIPG